jgi:hypothetical protein
VTVRENDQRQPFSREGTILHSDEAIVDGDCQIAKRHIFRFRLVAWIPDSA